MYCFPKGIEINIRVYNCLALRYYTTCILSVSVFLPSCFDGRRASSAEPSFLSYHSYIWIPDNRIINDFPGKPIPAQPLFLPVRYPELSPSPADSHVYEKVWSHCGDDLLACLMGYDAVSVQFYTTPPWGCRKSTIIAKITFVDITSLMMFTLAESLPVRPICPTYKLESDV